MRENLGPVRLHGDPKYHVALIHGGPGASGEMRPVGQELATHGISCLEPFQTSPSIIREIEELRSQIEKYANLPIYLVGHSWGAMLALLTAAKYPNLAKKG